MGEFSPVKQTLEFETVMQTRDEVEGLHKSCLYQAMLFFLNHLAPPSKGELMPKAPYFFISYWLKVHVVSLNLIAFIISIETEASFLALAKSINDWCILRR